MVLGAYGQGQASKLGLDLGSREWGTGLGHTLTLELDLGAPGEIETGQQGRANRRVEPADKKPQHAQQAGQP
jgi:hypothetical protein